MIHKYSNQSETKFVHKNYPNPVSFNFAISLTYNLCNLPTERNNQKIVRKKKTKKKKTVENSFSVTTSPKKEENEWCHISDGNFNLDGSSDIEEKMIL